MPNVRIGMTNPAGSDQSLSLWIDTTPSTSYPTASGEIQADVAIVGGGITGITAAYLLARAGKTVVLLEKGRIAMSETGHTTAHIVESTDADYGDLVKDHGEEGARLNTEASRSAIDLIRSLVAELSIDCDLTAVDGFLYAENEEDREYLQREQEFLGRAGVETEWTDEVPLPFKTIGGLHFRNQYAFHIRKYLLALAEAAQQRATTFFEQSLVNDVESGGDDGPCIVRTDSATIRARHVLLTTHVPINDRGTLWAKMHVTRTYVVAAPIEPGKVPNALFWDTEYPYHYTRLLETDDGLFLIVGGEDRDVGKEENDEERYRALEDYCRERFGITTFSHRWSGQINEPADMLPFIGESTHGKNVWMSTAYSGTGMTYGTLAAMMLSDFALGHENRFAKLYSPSRFKLMSVAENVVTKVSEVPKRLFEKLTNLDVEAKSESEVAEGEGKIVSIDGTKLALARIDGELCALNPTCTHMGCTVNWNGAEKSWDCPCHGSRFDIRGEVLNGPATTPLKRVERTED
jgi:glycine/D-amino acid oxidase-like deaminating enzyme/nitrite reductase/ring-hydroxylating ferredoxin subunit